MAVHIPAVILLSTLGLSRIKLKKKHGLISFPKKKIRIHFLLVSTHLHCREQVKFWLAVLETADLLLTLFKIARGIVV